MRTLLIFCSLLGSTAQADEADFSLGGHYRARVHSFHGLFPSYVDGETDLRTRYVTHQLRLMPVVDFQGRAKLMMQADALDGAVWGDNMSLSSTALFAGDPSANNIEGQPIDDFRISRAWTEFAIPVGLLRVGRQPSHWGMGLLANDGTGLDDTFGENGYGSTYDRIIFATRPLAVFQGFTGRDDSGLPLFVAIGADRLVEDPLIQYYGYKCEALGDADTSDHEDCYDSDIPYEDEDHGYSEDRDPSDRLEDWWADESDDVYEFVYVLIYKGEDLRIAGSLADLTAGAYAVHRMQAETDSDVWIYDLYLKGAWRKFRLEAEALTIRGETRGIVLAAGESDDPLAKEAAITSAVGRVGWETPTWTAMMEAGLASGDDDIADERLTSRAIHPDHNVGLLLYEEILARATADSWTEEGRGLWSKGGVYNSTYIYPQIRFRPLDGWELLAAYLMAWPDNPDGAIIRTDEDSDESLIGTELDLAFKVFFAEHMDFSLEYGRATITDRVPYFVDAGDPPASLWTLQTRIAYVF